MKILFIQTGGTIDKDYPRKTTGYAFEIGDPAVYRILDVLNPSFEYEVRSILKKDSLDITASDRSLIRTTIESASTNHIVITHGTDTMLETAEVLDGISGKVIIITGAMRPERFSNSDAAINLGMAIAAVQTIKEGVYIAMHGRVLPWQEVSRDRETGQYMPKLT